MDTAFEGREYYRQFFFFYVGNQLYQKVLLTFFKLGGKPGIITIKANFKIYVNFVYL